MMRLMNLVTRTRPPVKWSTDAESKYWISCASSKMGYLLLPLWFGKMVKFLIHLLLSTEEHFFYHCRSKRNDFFFDMLRNVTCCVTILNWHVTKLVPLANSCSKAQAYGWMFYDFIREETCSAVKRGGRMSRLIFEVLAFNLKLVSFGYFCRPVLIIFPALVHNFLLPCSVDTRYENLRLQAANRRHKLLDALSLHQLNRDAYIVDSWINEKVGSW